MGDGHVSSPHGRCLWCGRPESEYKEEYATRVIVVANAVRVVAGPLLCHPICAYWFQRTFYKQHLLLLVALHTVGRGELHMTKVVHAVGFLSPDRMYPNHPEGIDVYTNKLASVLWSNRYWVGLPGQQPLVYGTVAQIGSLKARELHRELLPISLDKLVEDPPEATLQEFAASSSLEVHTVPTDIPLPPNIPLGRKKRKIERKRRVKK